MKKKLLLTADFSPFAICLCFFILLSCSNDITVEYQEIQSFPASSSTLNIPEIYVPARQEWKSVFFESQKQDLDYSRGKAAEALLLYKKNMSQDKQNPVWYFLYGRLLGLLGKPEESLRLFRVSLQKSPDFVWGYYGLGLYYLKNNDLFHAELYFDVALQECLDFVPAMVGKAKIFAEKRSMDKAIDCLTQALKAMPEEASLYSHLGNLMMQLKKDEEAEKYLAEATRLEPNNRQFLKDLALFHIRQKKTREAYKILARLLGILQDEKEKRQIQSLMEKLEDVE